jgi:glycosyltransferase involved in cell wall biosynthesis
VKVAIVHDYLKEYGGAERVVEVLHEIFPDAPIYTAYLNLNGLGSHKARIKEWNVKTSWPQCLPFAGRLNSPLRLIAPKIFEGFDLSEYDVVISSCNIYFSKAVKTKKPQLHISYIHTPPRYLYGYATSFNYKKSWVTRVVGELINHYLRIIDFEVSQRPDVLIANSVNVQKRIKKFYKRDSEVIYPPVDTEKFKLAWTPGEGGYFLSVSRLVKGKNVEVIVKACTDLKLPLKVVGGGPQLEYLKSIAGRTVEFLGPVSDTHLPGIYASAGCTIVASEDEDFGIVPVESMASGTPVLGVKAGGFLETIIPGKTGEFFNDSSLESLKDALGKFNPDKYKLTDLQSQADKFSKEMFAKRIRDIINKCQSQPTQP